MGGLEEVRGQLKRLNSSEDKITSLSKTLFGSIQSSADLDTFCSDWLQSVKRKSVESEPQALLAYVYSANDIIQRCRKHTKDGGKDLRRAFRKVLPEAFGLVSSVLYGSEAKITRVLDVWEERKVFEQSFLTLLREKISMNNESDNDDEDYLSQEEEAPTPAELRRQESMRSEATEPSLMQLLNVRKLIETSRKSLKEQFAKFKAQLSNLNEDNVSKMSDDQLETWHGAVKQVLSLGEVMSDLNRSSVLLTKGITNSLMNKMSELEDKIATSTSKMEKYRDLKDKYVTSKLDKGEKLVEAVIRTEKRIAKRRRASDVAAEKRKKDEEEEEKRRKLAEEDRPMTYNKLLKAYVPVLKPGETESWREF